MKIIKNNCVVDDVWQVLQLPEDATAESFVVPSGEVIVPLAVWLAQRAVLQTRSRLGVWLDSHERAEALGADAQMFSVIAINFPKFADGRGYSIAHHLRVRLAYHGELRAIGDVLRDQLFYMQRVGFDAFALRANKDIHAALPSLRDFSECYQASVEQPQPLFRRVQR